MVDVSSSYVLLSALYRDEISKAAADASKFLRVMSQRGRIKPGRGYGVNGLHDGYADNATTIAAGGSLATFTADLQSPYALTWGRTIEGKNIHLTAMKAAASNGSPLEASDQFMVQLKKAVGGVVSKLNSQCFIGAGSGSNELVGLQTAIANTGSYAGIDRASVTTWRAHEFNSAGAIAIANVRKWLFEVEKGAVGVRPNLIVTTFEILQGLITLGDSAVQFNVAVQDDLTRAGFQWGMDYVSIMGVPVIADKHCPSGEMYGLNTDEMELLYLPPTGVGGGVPVLQANDGVESLALPLELHMLPSTSHSVSFTVVAESLLVVHQPSACFVATDITV